MDLKDSFANFPVARVLLGGKRRVLTEEWGPFDSFVCIPLSNINEVEPDWLEMARDWKNWQQNEGVSGQRARALAGAVRGAEEAEQEPAGG